MLKHGLLGLLNYEDMTGYDLMGLFRDSLSFFWHAQTSQIYKELQTLENNGWVVSQIVEQSGKPDKRIYHLTDSGKDELINWLKDYKIKPLNYPFLLKTFFIGELGPEESLPFFYIYREYCVSCLKNLQKSKDTIDFYEKRYKAPYQSLYWSMTSEYGIRETRMNIEWCDYCIEQIEKYKKEGE